MPVDKSYILPDESDPVEGAEVEVVETLDFDEGEPQIIEEADGGVTIDYDPFDESTADATIHTANLAEFIEDQDLEELATDLVAAFTKDENSREEWKEACINGLEMLGITNKDRNDPFPGASGVTHPLLAEAVTQFQAEAYKELLPADGPVSTKVLGKETPELIAQANRVKEYMNYQVLHVIEEYEEDLDQMLYYLPLYGSTFKKTYHDSAVARSRSEFVSAENLVVNYGAKSLEDARRITHIIPMDGNDIRALQLSGFYRDLEMPTAGEPKQTDLQQKIDELQGISASFFEGDEEYRLLEIQAYIDLPGFPHLDETGVETGLALPYIVTIDEDSEKVLSIRRNWEEADVTMQRNRFFTHYKFMPGLGFYGFGLIHMIGGLTQSTTSILRQLIDAGTLANLPGGFKSKNIRVEGSDDPIAPGEWRDIDAAGGNIRDSLMPLPYKEPSAVLTQLLGALTEAGQRFASVADNQIGETGSQQQPVGTTIAILERGMKVMSAIHKRLHRAQKHEFKLLAKVIAQSIPSEGYPYEVYGGDRNIMARDFDARIDVIPVSDPNIFSMAQRILLAQQQLQMAGQAPELHKMRAAYLKMYNAMGITDVEDILIPEEKPTPMSPALEHARVLENKKLEAVEGQDHMLHIEAHILFAQNPAVSSSPEFYANLVQDVMNHIGFIAQMQAGGQPGMVEQVEIQLMNQIIPRLAPPQQIDPIVELQDKQIEMQRENNQLDHTVDMAKIDSQENIAAAKITADLIKAGEKNEIDLAKNSLQQVEKITNNMRGVAGNG